MPHFGEFGENMWKPDQPTVTVREKGEVIREAVQSVKQYERTPREMDFTPMPELHQKILALRDQHVKLKAAIKARAAAEEAVDAERQKYGALDGELHALIRSLIDGTQITP